MSQFKYLDLEKWNRKNTFLFYKQFEDPCTNVSANINVTAAYNYSKTAGHSFFLLCLYYATRAANTIENFRYRMEGDKVRIYEKVHPGSTILYDDNTFGYAYFEYQDDVELFIRNGEKVIENQKNNRPFATSPPHNGFIYFSVIPWISFTSIKHARNNDSDHSIPRIVFGKYFRDGKKIMMPISVEVHHALVDGYHIGKYFKNLEENMCRL